MARNMYGATSADFTLTAGGRIVPGAVLTLWSARTGGTQITDLTDVAGTAITSVTSGADGSVVYYGPDADKDTHWAQASQGSRIAIRPVNITGETGATPALTVGTVGTGTAAASLTGTSEAPVLNLTLPTAGANGVNTAAIQDGAVTTVKIADGAVTTAKLATTGRFTFPTGAANGYGFASGAVHLSGTGSPEGVITAAPGSTWLQTDSTTDAKGWLRWVKATGTGNTGWVAGAEADTGWRDVSALYDGAVVSGGVITVRRIGNLVEMRMLVGWAQSTTTTGLTVLTLPSGFRPPANDYQTFQGRNFAGRGTPAGFLGSDHLIQANGAVSVYGCTATVTITADPKWVTGEAWPSSLPGSPA